MTDVSTQPIKRPPTRREAMSHGRRTYVGRPCRVHGPGAKRYTTSSGCVECAIANAVATKLRERELRAAEWELDDIEPAET
jgi:hypothetical protein